MNKLSFYFGIILLVSATTATADVKTEQASVKVPVTSEKANAASLALIKKRVKDDLQAEATSIKQTPIAGLYEVIVPPRVFYMSANGQYVITGELIDLKNSVNLTQSVRDVARVEAIESLGEENMVVFAPEKVKYTVTVFTDIDCGYCRKLHQEMPKYHQKGIKVRYLAYPRAGVGSPSYKKAVSVWCAEDRNKAMTDAKNGKTLPERECKNPVAAHYALGQGLGVNGTPAILLSNGQIYPGYAPADRLLLVLEELEKQSKAKAR